jgi:hypothetical protein
LFFKKFVAVCNLKSHHSPECVAIPEDERAQLCRENTCDWWQIVWNQRHLDNDLCHRLVELLMETSLSNLCDQIACEITEGKEEET